MKLTESCLLSGRAVGLSFGQDKKINKRRFSLEKCKFKKIRVNSLYAGVDL